MVEPNNNSLKEWALYYASLGLAVFPLKPKGKARQSITAFIGQQQTPNK